MEHYLVYYAVMCLMVLGIFATSSNQAGSFSSYGAYYYIHTGEAYNFYQQYEARIDKIENSGSVVEVEPFYWKPYFLCIGDLSTDPNSSANRAIADWYEKEAIYVVTE